MGVRGQLLSWCISVVILLYIDHMRHVDVMNKMESAKKEEMMQGTSYYQNSVDFYRGLLQGKEFLPIIIITTTNPPMLLHKYLFSNTALERNS